MVFDMHRLGYSQTQAVRAGMQKQLIAVTAPPGTGQMATVVNLIATAVMNGQSVLYPARRRKTVDAMTKHLNAWIGRNISAVVRVGDNLVNEACRKALSATLYEIQKPEVDEFDENDPEGLNEKPEKKSSSREKPTIKDMEELDRLPVADNEGVDPLRAAHTKVNELNTLMRREALELGLGQLPPARRMTPCPTRQPCRAGVTNSPSSRARKAAASAR